MKQASFFQTKPGQLLTVPVLILLAYVAGSLAIDRGNLWLYSAAIGLLILAVHQVARIVRSGR